MIKIIYLFVFSSIWAVKAQNDTIIQLQEVIVNKNASQSYNNFSKKIKNSKLYYQRIKANYSILGKETEEGIVYLSNLKIDSISSKNEKIQSYIQKILRIAYTSWYCIDNELLKKGFICEEKENNQWYFVASLGNTKINLDELDNFDILVKLTETRKLEQTTMNLYPKKGSNYKIQTFFRDFKKGIEISHIKGTINNSNDHSSAFNFEINFKIDDN